ncbi:hypothetical protein D9756_001866 [Leucocoprinus leucothites]|uniref:STAS domain-containing protein n=1 Tax=Leucocoprinus leucothites TaxID=201217 RepID=A0A8H5LHZ1_9AGAR|nr:hypothetical protein D9756_001866 [Leucoagaricus leucothites]
MVFSVIKDVTRKIVHYPEQVTEDVSTKEWLSRFWTNPLPHINNYLLSLFPIITWIHRYNLGWLYGDIIAGLTVGIVLVPQAMSYAQIADLPPVYGLYSSVVGTFIYCVFATSKDVSIGPTAVLALSVANLIRTIEKDYPEEWSKPVLASAICLVLGSINMGIGLLRIGWLVEFIPMPAIAGFMTGSALTIVTVELPGLMGITGFDTHGAPYKVFINTLKGLPHAKLDAVWGWACLFTLYAMRSFCLWAGKRWPHRARLFFFLGVLRNAVVILVSTVAAWLYCRKRRDLQGNFPISLLGDIPPGLQHMGLPKINNEMFSAMVPNLPVLTIISFLEHIAISKTLGRRNGYKINPNQELIAMGVANVAGSCFGALPSTGSFCRSALSSKSGIRTPLGGVITSAVVLVSLYGLTQAFYWIPYSVLCAVIIHAVADLCAAPSAAYKYWRISPLEFLIWFVTVLVTVFMSIEDGVYVSVCCSLLLLLIRLAHPRGGFMGRVALEPECESGQAKETREIFVPLKSNGIQNPGVQVRPPAPGVLVYKLEESYLYPNCSIVNNTLVDYVKKHTRRGKDLRGVLLRDRPWNDGGPRKSSDLAQTLNEQKPLLHAIVFDFSAVSHLDTTATQVLIDTRIEIERWTDYPVEFHFATIMSPWTRRALVAAGFGIGRSHSQAPRELAAIIADRDGLLDDDSEVSSPSSSDLEAGDIKTQVRETESSAAYGNWETLLREETPFFHPDLISACGAAESGLHRVSKFHEKKQDDNDSC